MRLAGDTDGDGGDAADFIDLDSNDMHDDHDTDMMKMSSESLDLKSTSR